VPAEWFDSHCHLDDERFAPSTAIAEAATAGVTRIVTVGVDAARSAAGIAIAAGHDNVWATVGLHPHDASQGLEAVVPLLDEAKVVAVGECGLDYHYDYSPRAVQREMFAAQVALANERAMTLVIHTREAWDDTFDILTTVGPPARTVFHCFSGGEFEARRALELDVYLSFSGIVTFKGAAEVRAAAIVCPLSRLLVETDAPYLAPRPHRGRPNHPKLLPVTGEALADLHRVDVEAFARMTSLNAEVAFGLRRS
jgi:TatD DNase family protein